MDKAGLATALQGGKLEEWALIIQGPYCAAIVEEKLGLPPARVVSCLPTLVLNLRSNYPLSTLRRR